jgi:hypothetical protein
MARGLVIEEESGTCTGRMHPHNGYYAGDFFTPSSAAVETAMSSSSQPLHLVAGFAGPSVTPTAARPGDRPSDRPSDLPRAA